MLSGDAFSISIRITVTKLPSHNYVLAFCPSHNTALPCPIMEISHFLTDFFAIRYGKGGGGHTAHPLFGLLVNFIKAYSVKK